MRSLFAFSFITFATLVAFAITVFVLNAEKGKGALQVTSEPNSKVYLNGKLIGQTPLCRCELKDLITAADYTIKLISTEGSFPPFEEKISISPKVLTVVDKVFADPSSASIIGLSKLSDKNSIELSVSSFPKDAKVFLDASEVGTTPFSTNGVTESDHEIRLERGGYENKSIRVRTRKGYRVEVLAFLGINLKETQKQASASASPQISTTKILILDTPTGFLRVRDAPSLGGNEIGQVHPGEKYDLLDEQNGWFKIKLKGGTVGWVSSQYAQKQT